MGKLTNNEKQVMIDALEQLKAAVGHIHDIWHDDGTNTGISKYDDALTPDYPFKESFFDVHHDVMRWVESSTENLKKQGDMES